jgi:polysaccharide biosynthesis/export protein
LRLLRILQRDLSVSSDTRPGRSSKRSLTAAAILAAATLMAGCDVPKSFIDPSEMGRYEKTPLQKPILSSLSSIDRAIDDPTDEFTNATEVRPEDLVVVPTDYVIGSNDLVNVTVSDLAGQGLETTKQTRVSESGNISLPLIGQVHADGLTEDQLQTAITAAYHNAQLITAAQVAVTVVEARARTFSVVGAINSPGQYAISQSDFRLLDALTVARYVLPNADRLYIIRKLSSEPGATPKPPSSTEPSTPANPLAPPPGSGGDPLAPRSQGPAAPSKIALMAVNPAAVAEATKRTGFAFNSPQVPSDTRIIHVPLDPLKNGDLRYNIVVRPGDMIIVPDPVVGEYYMGGHVARVGVYSLTAREITLKQAIIGAGMLDGLAIPQRTDIIRRIGTEREVFARVNLDAIFEGTEPDLFLKPYDQVMVGTNLPAFFISAVRGGFRITYGFGFLYDRNFSPTVNGQQQ